MYPQKHTHTPTEREKTRLNTIRYDDGPLLVVVLVGLHVSWRNIFSYTNPQTWIFFASFCHLILAHLLARSHKFRWFLFTDIFFLTAFISSCRRIFHKRTHTSSHFFHPFRSFAGVGVTWANERMSVCLCVRCNWRSEWVSEWVSRCSNSM